MSQYSDISVVIATHNRAEILRQTLESMAKLNRDNLSVEFVIVDNNSTDRTKEKSTSVPNVKLWAKESLYAR